MFTNPALTKRHPRRNHRNGGSAMTIQSDYARANEPNTLGWYATQLLGFLGLPPALTARVGDVMTGLNFRQLDSGRWVKVAPEPAPEAPRFQMQSRRTVNRAEAA